MTNAELVDVVDAGDELLEVLGGSLFLELLVLDDHVEEFTSAGEFHHEEQILLCLDNFINLNDIRMMQLF